MGWLEAKLLDHQVSAFQLAYRQVAGSLLRTFGVPVDAGRNPAVDRGCPFQSGGHGPLYDCPCESYASTCGRPVNSRRLLPRASSPTLVAGRCREGSGRVGRLRGSGAVAEVAGATI